MRTRILGCLAGVLGAAGAASAQPNAYPNPPQAPRSNAAPRPPATPTPSQYQAAPQANWYPNPTPNPIQQTRADGTPAAPAPQYGMPPMGAAAAAACPDPAAGYMKDVMASCGDSSCGSCDALCGPPGRAWVSAEYLRWTTKGNALPPLLTTAPAGTPAGVAGTVGDPRTTVLLGGNNGNNDWRNGIRANAGFWCGDDHTCGVEADFFYLGQSRYNAVVGSNGSQILTRPFTNTVAPNAQGNFVAVPAFADTELVSFPGILAGSATVDSTTGFIGGGGNFLCNAICNPCCRLDWLFGYRYLNLTDTLTVTENLTGLAGSAFPGTNFVVTDHFRTSNNFHGANGGFAYERRLGRLYLGFRGAVALGVTHTVTDIDGSTRVTETNGNVTNLQGGLLAQSSNIGRYTANSFSVVPEAGVKLGVQVTDNLRVYGGYNYLFWSNVIRTGGVIDTRVNASLLPPSDGTVGPAFPRYEPGRTSFYAHGVSIGLELRY